MIALGPTSLAETMVGAAKANLGAVPSLRVIFDASQKGGAANRRLSRLHPVGVRVHENPKGTPKWFLSVCVPRSDLLKTGAGFTGRRPFPHSHWSRSISLAATTREVSSFSALPRVNSLRSDGSRRLCARTLTHQQTVNVSADALHSQAVLSNYASSAGSKYPATRGQKIGNSGQVGAA